MSIPSAKGRHHEQCCPCSRWVLGSLPRDGTGALERGPDVQGPAGGLSVHTCSLGLTRAPPTGRTHSFSTKDRSSRARGAPDAALLPWECLSLPLLTPEEG